MLSFVLIVYLARKLGDYSFGKFFFAGAFVQIFIMLADLGVSFLIIREVARDRANTAKYFGNGFFIKALLSFLTFGLMIMGAHILKCPPDTRAIIYLVGLCYILESMANLCGSIFRAFERMQYIFWAELIEKAARVLLCFLFLSLGYGLLAVAWLYLFSAVLYLGLNMIFLFRNIGKPSFRPDIAFAWSLLRESLPFALTGLLLTFYYYIDAVMLGRMKGELVVGWYSASYQLYIALGMMASVFLSAVFPVMARLAKTSLATLRKVYEKCFKYLLALGLPLAAGGVLLGKPLILLFYGAGFHNSVLPFQLIMAIIAFSYINSLLSYFLTAVDRIHDNNKLFAVCVLTNVGLNFALIPPYSYAGAAIATMTSEALFCVLALIYVSRNFGLNVPWNPLLKALAAAGIMGVVAYLAININLALLIALSALLYFVLLRLFGYFNQEDKLLFKEVIGLRA